MIILGVGEYGSTVQPDEVIKTYGLGSCVAVLCHDPVSGIVGMLHVALPDSSVAQDRPPTRIGYFADTGVPALFENMQRLGWRKAIGQVRVKLAGGASILDPKGTFNIGKRNQLAIKRILWRLGFSPIAEDLGGNYSRTVSIAAKTGEVLITTPGRDPVRI